MAINKVTLYGHQICDHVWALNTAPTAAEITSLGTLGFEPYWTDVTEFLAVFNGNLIAGNISYGAEEPVRWNIYRQRVGDNNLELVGFVDAKYTSVIDYVIRNNNTYQYYMSAVTDSYVGTQITTSQIATNWSNWCLFSVDPTDFDNEYIMHEALILDLDVVSGAMQNNTQSTLLHNFTPYPKVQKGKTNYYSGTISALLGSINCSTNKFTDSVALSEQLKAMSTDGRRKFLKDRKGDLWEVELTIPTNWQLRDNHIEQPYDIMITWSEINKVENIMITNRAREVAV